MLQLLQINLFTCCKVLTHFGKLKQCWVNEIANALKQREEEYTSRVYLFVTVLLTHNGGVPDTRNMSTFQMTPTQLPCDYLLSLHWPVAHGVPTVSPQCPHSVPTVSPGCHSLRLAGTRHTRVTHPSNTAISGKSAPPLNAGYSNLQMH